MTKDDWKCAAAMAGVWVLVCTVFGASFWFWRQSLASYLVLVGLWSIALVMVCRTRRATVEAQVVRADPLAKDDD